MNYKAMRKTTEQLENTRKHKLANLLKEEAQAEKVMSNETPCRVLFKDGEEKKYFIIEHGPEGNREDFRVTIDSKVNDLSPYYSFNHPKVRNKLFVHYHGMTRATFRKLFTFYYYKTFVDPVSDLVGEFGFGGFSRKVSPKRLSKLYNTADLLRQNKKDGVENISWLCFETGMDTKQLKERLGKGVWKSLCKNTKSRNKALSSVVARNLEGENKQLLLREVISLPTTLFRYVDFNQNADAKIWAYKVGVEGKLPIKHLSKWEFKCDFHTLVSIYQDTKRMAIKLFGETPDLYNLSPRRVKELHEEYTKELQLRKVKEPNTVFKSLSAGKRNILYEVVHPAHPEWTATLLTRPVDVIEEGKAQRHCVGSYVDSVACGDYLVYSIRKSGDRYSTLGMYNNNGRWFTQQHYKACNQIVDYDEALGLQKFIEEWYLEMNKYANN